MKLIDMDNDNWKKFGKYCVNHDITIKKKLNDMIIKVLEEDN